MKNFHIIAVLMSLSISSFADEHLQGKELFKRFDANGDGKISTAEHEKVIQQIVKKRRQRFAEMDTDGDGLVSKSEAKAAGDKKKQRLEDFKEKRDKRFERMDSNGDGVFSKDEVQPFNWW